jgi:hypothetical protein
MNFKLVSKENLGCVILLLLVVVLSLSKTFNITPETHLGRVILILFVLVISYLNNILGVVAVLFIIIILSGNNMFYQEGFDSNMSNTSSDSSKSDISKDTKKEKEVTEVQKGDNTVDVSSNQHIPTPPTSTMPQIKPPSNESSTITSSIASSASTEGFDIIGLENDMKKGKQSNSIPVNAFMRESQFVSAYEANPFKESFANF